MEIIIIDGVELLQSDIVELGFGGSMDAGHLYAWDRNGKKKYDCYVRTVGFEKGEIRLASYKKGEHCYLRVSGPDHLVDKKGNLRMKK